MRPLPDLRAAIRSVHRQPEEAALARLREVAPDAALRQAAGRRGAALVRHIRADADPGLMEVFLAEYGLSTDEGIALMCLAEALLRVPDPETIDALIEDKIAPSAWGAHLGHSSSSLVNASTWALMLTGKVLERDRGTGMAAALRGAVKRLGEPVIRTAVGRAMRELGQQFVLGETIEDAVRRGRDRAKRGYTYSYDMLGEAAMTAADADGFFASYADAIDRLARHAGKGDIRSNPGISIKLSALHPRYEAAQAERVMTELVPRVLHLAQAARRANMGLNIDAEEADRLDLSLDVIERVLRDSSLEGWDGFGVVVQAYGKRALPVIDWLHALAERLDRRIMVRLVKGAYWDTEIKHAQVEGLAGFPVFTRKPATDVSFLCCAQRLLDLRDRIYPQFATHNAHTVACVLEMAGSDTRSFEFQRLHGMGEALHDAVLTREGTACRIYAPVGAHRDLLAYLVRRLLENGANSSFVNQIVDETIPPEQVAADPFDQLDQSADLPAAVQMPAALFRGRRNSRGWDLSDPLTLADLDGARAEWRGHQWQAAPLLACDAQPAPEVAQVQNPADPGDIVGQLALASAEDAAAAASAAQPWAAPPAERAAVLRRASDLYEEAHPQIFALLAREAGKGLPDAVAELREAVDFLRYYANEAERLVEGAADDAALGAVSCISPWNFPLAIFTGQIAAALAAGNAVLAKPAEATGLIAHLATGLLHRAGVPRAALQLLPGHGATVGAALSAHPDTAAMAFTGSTATAQAIHRSLARHAAPHAPLIAETGGLNAMIVDSTALPEQAIRDVVMSAVRSAGQRCSALRILYVQRDIAESFTAMLKGAMDELSLGDPWRLDTDIGPVIDDAARRKIEDHITAARQDGRLLHRVEAPARGYFVPPSLLRVDGIEDLEQEIFGPVLHLATYRAEDLDRVVDAINASGYGLTFGLHSRIDDRVEQVSERIKAGNVYINRNQIGAVVGSQPFGGEGLSGTGPKAGGPHYVARFRAVAPVRHEAPEADTRVDRVALARALEDADLPHTPALSTITLPGPTGESNRLTVLGRGTVLCLGPTARDALAQARIARAAGCQPVAVAPGLRADQGLDGTVDPAWLSGLTPLDLVVWWGDDATARALRIALSDREGAIVGLVTGHDLSARCRQERHICIDTTAAGGNASLLAASS
ncbi:bifunctional proline dehydrogenase/L-glutamate gamma-semialdehyde dehydrogenase PutA [Brevirhabdus sp.]|uniref:bifunctional proline dehydrogenase/L-glutamate gamma-semialdehyde dehydrogenase PutA n=1 Tax=Brevirhabdus sp. TaxID=2004514 RepID=UPI00405979C3